MKLTYLVNMNHPGCLPSYDANEHDTIKEAATTALDVVDALISQQYTPEPGELDTLIDIENGTKEWTTTDDLNVYMTSEHDTLVVFIRPLLTPEVI